MTNLETAPFGKQPEYWLERVRAFTSEAKGPVIVHLAETDSQDYPLLQTLLQTVCPAAVVYTGSQPVGDTNRLLAMLTQSAGHVYATADDSLLPCSEKLTLLRAFSRISLYGVTLETDRQAIPAAYGADFALYGGEASPCEEVRPFDGVTYLNGCYNWTLIDCVSKKTLRVPCRNPERIARIFIIRHGQTGTHDFIDNNPDLPAADPGLSDDGIRQAKWTALEMKRLNFSGRIYSSPFLRTLLTAQQTARAVGTPVYPERAIQEIVKTPEKLYDFHPPRLDELRGLMPEIASDAELPYPWWETQVETMREVSARVCPFVDRVLAMTGDIALFGHGASTAAAIDYLMEKSGLAFNDYMPKPLAGNAGLSIFRAVNGVVTPLRVLGTNHLPATLMTNNPHYALNEARETPNENAQP